MIDANDIRSIQNAVQDVYVDELVYGYIVDIVRATRKHPDIYLGASPRASLGLFRSTQALAAIRGRGYVVPDDVKHLAESVIAHRIIVSPAARIRNIETRNIVFEILDSVPVPGASAT